MEFSGFQRRFASFYPKSIVTVINDYSMNFFPVCVIYANLFFIHGSFILALAGRRIVTYVFGDGVSGIRRPAS